MTADTGTAIRVQGLSKRYRGVAAVDGLSFDVREGAVTGFLGPNGAGKTTTLRVLLGLAAPTAGTATIFRVPYHRLKDPIRTVGAALEISGFHPGRSGRNHLRTLATLGGVPRSRVEEVLKLVELSDAGDRRASKYSMGMRQRLALASALLGDPRLLVLDEPANGLDPQGIRWLRDFLRSLAAEGRTVLVSSHVLAEVAQTVDDVIVVHHGKLVDEGPVAKLSGPDHVRVRSPQADRIAEALARGGADVGREQDGSLVVTGMEIGAVGDAAFAAGAPVHELTSVKTSLEDVFLALTSDAPAAEATPEGAG